MSKYRTQLLPGDQWGALGRVFTQASEHPDYDDKAAKEVFARIEEVENFMTAMHEHRDARIERLYGADARS